MRRFLLAFLWLSLQQPAAAQLVLARSDVVATHLQLSGADCALFPAAAALPPLYFNETCSPLERFTPTPQQLALVEKTFLPSGIQQLAAGPNVDLVDYDKEKRVFIYRNLKKYYRQYYGFYNCQHQQCLYINCFLGDDVADGPIYDIAPYWLRSTVCMLYGGANYWSITFNLATQELYGFRYNSSRP